MALSKLQRHIIFNIMIIVIPWLSLILLGKRNIKRYSVAGIFIVVFEIINHMYGKKKKWWAFYSKPRNFLKDELPFSIGPYAPLSMWLLKLSFGNFKLFVLLNVIFDALFTWPIMSILKKIKIIRLNKLNKPQFFLYIHYKAYLLYGLQFLVEKFSSGKWESAKS